MGTKVFRSENGSALVIALFFVVMVSVLGLTAFYVTNTEISASSAKYEKAKALYLAEGGLERAVLELQGGIGNGWDDEVAGADGQSGTQDDGILDFGSQVPCYANGEGGNYTAGGGNSFLGHYDVKLVDGRRPGESPGKCNRVIVGSDGISTKGYQRRVEAEVQLWELTLPQCLVYIDGQSMSCKWNGQSFKLDGKDWNPNGTRGPGPDVPAILVPKASDASSIRSGIKNNECDQVLGVGNMTGSSPCTPSVKDLTSWNPNTFNPARFRGQDLPKLEGMVNNVIAGGTYSGQQTIGSQTNFLITRCTGDLHISGQFEGYGILIIDGSLKITGKGRWDGLIIVKNEAEMAGGGNGFHLYGTMLVMDISGIDGANEFTMSGQADGFYCTANVTQIQNTVRTLSVNRWRQTAGL